jgi:DNA polymerase III epsilon subunit-like protein
MSNSQVREQLIVALFQRWLSDDCVVVDTETTGLGNDDEIVEITIVTASGHVLLDTLVKPQKPIPEDVAKIHGITNEMVSAAPTWADIHYDVTDAMTGKTVVMWNSAFDTRLIKQTFDKSPKSPFCANRIYSLASALSNVQCAMLAYAEFWGDWNAERNSYRWQRLGYAAEQQGVKIEGTAHRALCDVKTTIGVIRAVAAGGAVKP